MLHKWQERRLVFWHDSVRQLRFGALHDSLGYRAAVSKEHVKITATHLKLAEVKVLVQHIPTRFWESIPVYFLGNALLVTHRTGCKGLNGLVIVQVSTPYLRINHVVSLIAQAVKSSSCVSLCGLDTSKSALCRLHKWACQLKMFHMASASCGNKQA